MEMIDGQYHPGDYYTDREIRAMRLRDKIMGIRNPAKPGSLAADFTSGPFRFQVFPGTDMSYAWLRIPFGREVFLGHLCIHARDEKIPGDDNLVAKYLWAKNHPYRFFLTANSEIKVLIFGVPLAILVTGAIFRIVHGLHNLFH